jgi:hypothetical protein
LVAIPLNFRSVAFGFWLRHNLVDGSRTPPAVRWQDLRAQGADNVIVYGPDGQQVTVSEKEAKRRVTKGWTLQAPTRS